MKTYHYKKGHEAKTTLTVSELIEKLKKYPDDMPVIPTWESIHTSINSEEFEVVSGYHCGKPEEAEDILVIDVDQW